MKRFWIASFLAFALVGCSISSGGFAGNAPVLPEIVSSHGVATFDISTDTAASGLPEFVYQGKPGVAPTIRVNPGDTIVVNLTNHNSSARTPTFRSGRKRCGTMPCVWHSAMIR
ncbi:MAG TPA: hypothetical protein VFE36_04365 [Candidatus Baltobacteraceae bacterium]|nr:hypothetical protein [Candidatus Baltobacteraceae bacterium]